MRNILIVDDELETGNYIAQVITEHFNYCICQIAKTYDSALDYIVKLVGEILRRFKSVGKFGKLVRRNSVENYIRLRNRESRAEHTKFKLVTGKRKGRGTVTVGQIL